MANGNTLSGASYDIRGLRWRLLVCCMLVGNLLCLNRWELRISTWEISMGHSLSLHSPHQGRFHCAFRACRSDTTIQGLLPHLTLSVMCVHAVRTCLLVRRYVYSTPFNYRQSGGYDFFTWRNALWPEVEIGAGRRDRGGGGGGQVSAFLSGTPTVFMSD